jgi:hypothetical protein
MNKQDKLNNFIRDFGIFIETYYSKNISEINFSENKNGAKLIIKGFISSDIITVFSEDNEITVCLGEDMDAYWHIDDYGEPCKMENIFSQTINQIKSYIDGDKESYKFFENLNDVHCSISALVEKNTKINEILNTYKIILRKRIIRFIKIKKWGSEEDVYRIKKVFNYLYLIKIS